jgi:FkbM family methyltransferase
MAVSSALPTPAPGCATEAADLAYIPHLGWLSHDPGEQVIYLLRQGHFEAAEQAFCWLYLRPGDTFIDCGAHIGLYSVLAAKATNGKAHVVAVEANANTARHLVDNLDRNNVKNALTVNAAVWEAAGEVRFLANKGSQAAYDHVAFVGEEAESTRVPATTLSQLVADSGGKPVALVKIDVEGAEPEVLVGGKSAIEADLLPVLMIEFTESNLQRRGLDTNHLFGQLVALGYTPCEFASNRMEVVPFNPTGPVWYKNLFACRDLDLVNQRLAAASRRNRQIAVDLLGRADACSSFKELEELDNLRKLAEKCGELRLWAEQSDAALATERDTLRQLREWAERNEVLLAAERDLSRQLRDWAERSEALLLTERENSTALRRWAEQSDATLATERESAAALRQLAEQSNAALAAERDLSRQLRDWAERSEALLLTERENSTALRRWAEQSDAGLAAERILSRQLREWAEQSDTRLLEERELTAKLKQENKTLRESIASKKQLLLRLVGITKPSRTTTDE